MGAGRLLGEVADLFGLVASDHQLVLGCHSSAPSAAYHARLSAGHEMIWIVVGEGVG